jgi:hypothetical protein
MPLHNPVAVYNAGNNFEAQLICRFLNDAGIEAYPTEDVSQVGVCMFGLMSEIHKPQVWVDRADAERAKPILEDYEDRQIQRQHTDSEIGDVMDEMVGVTCEECGEPSEFPAAQRGTVQECPCCGAYMDVEDARGTEDEWWRDSVLGEDAGEEL